MIDSTSSTTQGASAAPVSSAAALGVQTGQGGGFDAALQAASRAEANRKAQENELAEIREKGFTAWVKDTQLEKLKELLRRKIMAEMGLTEEDLGKMGALLRQTLEARIKNEVETRLATALANQDESGSSERTADGADGSPARETQVAKAAATVLAAQEESTATASPTRTEEEKKDRQGNFGMVIPALAMPGGGSLF